MSQPSTKLVLKTLMQGASRVLLLVGGLSFLVGGRAIHEFAGVDRFLAEMIGLGIAFACLIVGMVAKHKIEDIEWEVQNEEAERNQKELDRLTNDPHA